MRKSVLKSFLICSAFMLSFGLFLSGCGNRVESPKNSDYQYEMVKTLPSNLKFLIDENKAYTYKEIDGKQSTWRFVSKDSDREEIWKNQDGKVAVVWDRESSKLYWDNDEDNSEFNPIRSSLVMGGQWGSDDNLYTITHFYKSFTVQAGEFTNVVEVTKTYQDDLVNKMYYASDVGLILSLNEKNKPNLELVKFE